MQLQTQEPRLAVKVDVIQDKKTSERKEEAAPDEIRRYFVCQGR